VGAVEMQPASGVLVGNLEHRQRLCGSPTQKQIGQGGVARQDWPVQVRADDVGGEDTVRAIAVAGPARHPPERQSFRAEVRMPTMVLEARQRLDVPIRGARGWRPGGTSRPTWPT
jgi:hypothetical protein